MLKEWIMNVPLGSCIPCGIHRSIIDTIGYVSLKDDTLLDNTFVKLQYATQDSILSMILQCIPYGMIPYSQKELLVLNHGPTLVLHPQVAEFLVLSAQTIGEGETLSYKDSMVEIHSVSYSNATPPATLSKLFRIQPISSNILVVPSQVPYQLCLTLQYIACTDDAHDSLLQYIFSPFMSSSNTHHFKNQQYISSLLLPNLQGSLIQEQACIALPLPRLLVQSTRDHDDVYDDMIVIFFLISSIDSVEPSESLSTTHNSIYYYYYLETTHNLHLKIKPGKHDKVVHDSSDKVSTLEYIEDTTCPGYEHVLNDLLSLARLKSSIASPAATLLMGCAGVGKTRLVSTLLHHLVQQEDDINLDIKYISAKDVVLAASTFTQLQELIYYVCPQLSKMNHTTWNSDNGIYSSSMHRIVLILDDLDILLQEEESSQQDYDRISALYAITEVMDRILSFSQKEIADDPSIPFILGVCCSDDIVKSNVLVRKGRFEKIIVMQPPTQHQRQIILDRLLQNIPLIPLIPRSNDISIFHKEPVDDKITTVLPNTKEHELVCSSWTKALASQTAGCVAADLKRIQVDALTRSMARKFQNKIPYQVDGRNSVSFDNRQCILRWADLRESARMCVPSQLANLDVSIPRTWDVVINSWSDENLNQNWRRIFDSSWECFGGYKEMKDHIYRSVVRPWRSDLDETSCTSKANIDVSHEILQISLPSGVLLHGPSGTGKTLAASCLASSLSLNIIQVRASDILNKWLGGSEAILRSIFGRARGAAPCILFFDDIESISSNRESDSDGSSSDVFSRILSTLLNEMDGVSSGVESIKEKVLVVATTNRIEDIDAALLRPGRLDVHVHVGKPHVTDALDIFGLNLLKVDLHSNVNLLALAESIVSLELTGANIQGICEDACMNAIDKMRSHNEGTVLLTKDDFDSAMQPYRLVI